MTNKIDYLREWLNHNKVFFETIGVIGVTIVVSYASPSISTAQNQMIENENRSLIDPDQVFDQDQDRDYELSGIYKIFTKRNIQ